MASPLALIGAFLVGIILLSITPTIISDFDKATEQLSLKLDDKTLPGVKTLLQLFPIFWVTTVIMGMLATAIHHLTNTPEEYSSSTTYKYEDEEEAPSETLADPEAVTCAYCQKILSHEEREKGICGYCAAPIRKRGASA